MKKEILRELADALIEILDEEDSTPLDLEKLKNSGLHVDEKSLAILNEQYPPKMGILIDVDKMHKMELVRDLFGDEKITKLLYQDGKDYDIEVLVRRK